ncbi:MAG TPA: cytochrome c nitrite reductase small subunit [Rhodothermia bacterium]|nr:cytochrome c nitrite reductase small subunit [Rhodothermia bacterium]
MQTDDKPVRSGARTAALILPAALGILLGLGGFTFYYGEGWSYFSSDPKACVNCHIMDPNFDSWQKASHHTVAGCVDCHLPNAFVPKWMAKAENGFWHSKGFTLQDFPEPIVIRDKNLVVLEDNCRSCHGGILEGTLSQSGADRPMNCVHCHRSVGHGETAGMGKLESATARQSENN